MAQTWSPCEGRNYKTNSERPSVEGGGAVHSTAGAEPVRVELQGPAVRAGRAIENPQLAADRLVGRGTLPIEEGNEERVLQCISIKSSHEDATDASRVECDVGQATKGAQWMPWQHGPKKGVVRLR